MKEYVEEDVFEKTYTKPGSTAGGWSSSGGDFFMLQAMDLKITHYHANPGQAGLDGHSTTLQLDKR